MYLFAWIFTAILVGWGARRMIEENSYGPFTDAAIRSAASRGLGDTIVTTMIGVIGVALLTALDSLVNGRRIYARQS
jgi:biotin transporter BioY